MEREKFEKWLELKINESLEYTAKDEVNKAFMLGATKAMTEILYTVRKGNFDNQKR